MYEDVTVVIPSSGRPARQTTLAQLPRWLLSNLKVAMPAGQVADYAESVEDQHIWPVPADITGISATRAWLLDQCCTPYMLMLDDDMVFAQRLSMTVQSLTRLYPGDKRLVAMLVYWRALMDRYIHVGLSARQGNNRVHKPVRQCCRMYNAYMYNVSVLRRLVQSGDVVTGRLPVMEDFDLTLQLLRLGYPNAVIYQWCWNQPCSNAAGGCSSYRTAALQQAAALRLASLHPGLVKVVAKATTNWDGMNTRMDVVVQWARAYKQGLASQAVNAPGSRFNGPVG